MKILAVGDIVGKNGLQKLKDCLPNIIKENNIDFVIVNGENAAEGMGITEKMYKEILALNVNIVTMGNHTWGKKEIFNFIEDEHIIRPANYTDNNPGKGYRIYKALAEHRSVSKLPFMYLPKRLLKALYFEIFYFMQILFPALFSSTSKSNKCSYSPSFLSL